MSHESACVIRAKLGKLQCQRIYTTCPWESLPLFPHGRMTP